jgi:CRP/FNR family cyclic AMP-dependent transcriptional regulator
MTDRSYFDLFARADQDAVSYAKGDAVFEAGAAGDCFFVVRSGAVRLHAGDHDVEAVTPGGIFGEMALVDGSSRSLSATAASDCELIRIDEPRFHYLVHEAPYFAQEVMRVMAERLRASTQRLG